MRFFVLLFLVIGCVSTPKPDIVPVPDSPEAPEEPTKPDPVVDNGSSSIETLLLIAQGSRCARTNLSRKGIMPKGYIKGMALAYAKTVCRSKDPNDGFFQVVNQPLKSAYYDALAHYGLQASAKNLYTLLIGLGPRESSGRYCEGRDRSATNTSSNSAEAGVFQTSYDSVGAHRDLPKLMAYYQANPSKCQLAVWKEGVSCRASDLENFGSGTGLAYQKLNKSCPAFAAEWAAVVLRNLRRHYGPINRKEAQVHSECRDMFGMIEEEIARNPSVCKSL